MAPRGRERRKTETVDFFRSEPAIARAARIQAWLAAAALGRSPLRPIGAARAAWPPPARPAQGGPPPARLASDGSGHVTQTKRRTGPTKT